MRSNAAFLMLGFLILAACGDEVLSDDQLLVEPLPGVYIVDVVKTTKGRAKDADGHDVTMSKKAPDQVQAGISSDVGRQLGDLIGRHATATHARLHAQVDRNAGGSGAPRVLQGPQVHRRHHR